MFKMKKCLFIKAFLLFIFVNNTNAEVSDTDLNELSKQQNSIKINKCCESNELMVDSVCRLSKEYNQSNWEPQFKTEDGKDATVKYFAYVNGVPNCSTTQQRPIFDFGKSEDELKLLLDGRLQHLINHEHSTGHIKDDPMSGNAFSIHEAISIPAEEEPSSYIHTQNKYCLDKRNREGLDHNPHVSRTWRSFRSSGFLTMFSCAVKILSTSSNTTGLYALVCVPEVIINWKETNFIIRKIINPLFHAIAMILFLLVSIIYFVLPTLRDLAGNIITTINVCLIISQAADLVRIFSEFSNHISFMVADIILYINLLGAFFWLNSFGFYIWKTFKSRNVFLRVTDVRKYCYYSSVVWSCVFLMAVMAICAHFLLDTSTNAYKKMRLSSTFAEDMEQQETIGWLGIAVFFTPIAFTIVFNLFFYVTTLKVIKRINIYGRIHYKLIGCFNLFLQLFLIMTMAWLFLLLSWLNFDGLYYAHVIVNLLQAILIFYVCVLRQSHVMFLLRKVCCYAEPIPTGEWGDEMTHMNGGNY